MTGLELHRYEHWGKSSGYQQHKKKYYVFKVIYNDFVLYEYSQLNSFMEYFEKYEDVLLDAQEYARGAAKALGVPFPELKTFQKQIVPEVEQWVEVQNE